MKPIVAFTLAMTLVACQLSQGKSAVMDSLGCKVPCWKGITPGETDMGQLLITLKDIPAIDKGSVASVGVQGTYFDDIVRSNYIERNARTRVEVYLIEDEVALISLDYVQGDWNLTLEDTMEAFGEPKNLLLVRHDDDIFINLVNAPRGIIFGYNTIDKPKWWREQIAPENKIGWMLFFDPNSLDQLMETGELSFGILFGHEAIDRMQPWDGYGSIGEKYYVH